MFRGLFVGESFFSHSENKVAKPRRQLTASLTHQFEN